MKFMLVIAFILALLALSTIVSDFIKSEWAEVRGLDDSIWIIQDYCNSKKHCEDCRFYHDGNNACKLTSPPYKWKRE